MNYDLSILIPARNEMFLAKTVENILENIRGNTEIIVALDGGWPPAPIKDHERVTLLYLPTSIGQRAATNQACRLSKAKYVMKLDAHCAVDEGFDVKMMEEMKDHYTMVPTMYNLHGFDWVCKGVISGDIINGDTTVGCGHRIYQGPTPEKCEKCGGRMEREIIWKPRKSRQSMFFRFDKTLHFQYWGAFKERPEAQGNIAPTLSLQGSCFMLTRQKYWELNMCDEKHGSWGQQGVEVALKTWLSGGEVMVNKKTWYSHMFRTQGGDFGFPYPLSQREIDKAREYSRELWIGNKWPQAKHDLNWLLDKFYPVPDWHDDSPEEKGSGATDYTKGTRKGILFYTDNQLNLKIAHSVQKQLKKVGLPIISSSLKEMSFGNPRITMKLKRGYLTMAKQILQGLRQSEADIIYFAEHDVLYHPSHFEFIPSDKDKYYYNTNVWRVRLSDGHALYTDNLQQLSGLVAYRETLLKHYEERVRQLEAVTKSVGDNPNLFNRYIRAMGFEPGTHGRPERVDDLKAESFQSKYPNIDIRHDGNLTPSRWSKEQFRNERYTKGWKESTIWNLPGWHIPGGEGLPSLLAV